MNPFVLMTILYAALAIFVAAASALSSYGLIPWFEGLRWLRVHVITLGVVSEALFGPIPVLLAALTHRAQNRVRWDIWLTLNVGLLALLIGMPLKNQPTILLGGTLVFVASGLFTLQLFGFIAATRPSLKFYVAGLIYLLVGILIGTGLWLGWSVPLAISVPIEAHIHANNWGFMSLLFAGLIIDSYPQVTGRSLAGPKSLTAIFWMMVFGALGLVLGPWLGSNTFAVPGLLLHLAATVWLLVRVLKPLAGDARARTLGMGHLVTSYVWILAPVLTAPFVIAGVPGFPGPVIEANAPQALIYGWVLLFSYAMIPYLLGRVITPATQPRYGGNVLSLIAVHTGAAALWLSIFLTAYQRELSGAAYALWALSMIPIGVQVVRSLTSGAPPEASQNVPAHEQRSRYRA